MRIACPACNAAYQVPDGHLSEGRVVRCARCGTDWAPLEPMPVAGDIEAETIVSPPMPEMPVSEMPVSETPVPETPEPAIQPRTIVIGEDIPLPRPPMLPSPRPAERGPAWLIAAWVLSVVVVAAAAAGLYAGRERVMTVWPPSMRAYGAIGLAAGPAASERRQ